MAASSVLVLPVLVALFIKCAPPLPLYCANFCAPSPTPRRRSEALLSIVPSMDFDSGYCSAFSAATLWQRKLLAGLKALALLLTCALAVVSSFFTYSVRLAARAACCRFRVSLPRAAALPRSPSPSYRARL
jgi:hypothetical protein